MSDQAKPKITVYWLDRSRAQRILWLLEELKLDYEIKVFKRDKDNLAPPELKKIHPLGKAPIVGVTASGAEKEMILAESAYIVEYLTGHLGQWLIPKQYAEGKEGQIGGETEEYRRYRYFMHYSEGSLMPFLVMSLVMNAIRDGPQPFFVRPITRAITNRVQSTFLAQNVKANFDFLEQQLETSPSGGEFLCGKELTGADILMIFPLEAAHGAGLFNSETHPKLVAYVKRLQEREASLKAEKRIEETTGEKYQRIT
ncbi:MAG: hypothetical protein M1820_003545 [Bogoriella megaspora]|nr:MAG: hypothetical protein M1820_003545 [Bogoriella megaspora]